MSSVTEISTLALGKQGEMFGVPADRVHLKAKTNEGVDAVGRGEAIAAHAVATLAAT